MQNYTFEIPIDRIVRQVPTSDERKTPSLLFLAAYRTVVNPRLRHHPFAASSYLSTDTDVFPIEYWPSSQGPVEDNLARRKETSRYIHSIVNFLDVEMATVRNRMNIEHFNIVFNQSVSYKFKQFSNLLSEFNKQTNIEASYKNVAELKTIENRLETLLSVMLDFLEMVRNICESNKIDSSVLNNMVLTFYVSSGEIGLMVDKYTSISSDINEMIHMSLEKMQQQQHQPPPSKTPTFTDDLSSELNIFKKNLDAILEWLLSSSTRFSILGPVYESMLLNKVLHAETMSEQFSSGVTKKKIHSFINDYKTPKWLVEDIDGDFANLNWLLVLTNYVLNFGIDIIYIGMKGFMKFANECSSELQIASGQVSNWVLQTGSVFEKATSKPVQVVRNIKNYYQLIVRACYICSKAWNFESITSEYKDSVWESELKLVNLIHEESLDNTNEIATRGGVKFRIKRSNIKEAGLGLFLDDDLNSIKSADIKAKFTRGSWGLPLLVYDGYYLSERESKVLYAGNDTLRPYSVGTSSDTDNELDAFHGNNSDIARFINDSFNRVPLFGSSPDTRNLDPKKRTFTYTVRFLWVKVPNAIIKPKRKKVDDNNMFAINDRIIEYLRTTSETQLGISNIRLPSDNDSTYVLALYTNPLDTIPSTEPTDLFTKGQELWISYGKDYLRRISSSIQRESLDYSYITSGGFVGSRRTQHEIATQENITAILDHRSLARDATSQETFKDTIDRAIITSQILSSRPFNASDNYYTYALDKISSCFPVELITETIDWIDKLGKDDDSKEHYIKNIFAQRIFAESKIRKDLNCLRRDTHMDTIVSILTLMCAVYYACILQLIDTLVNISWEKRNNYDEDCLPYLVSIAGTPPVRLPGLELFRQHMESCIELLKDTSIEWHVKQRSALDLGRWFTISDTFRLDLDSFIDRLVLSAVTIEGYQKTKSLVDKEELGAHGIGNIMFIANSITRAIFSTDSEDYLEDVPWMTESTKHAESTKEIVSELFDTETANFQKRMFNRMSKIISLIKKDKQFSNLVVDFTDKTIDIEKLAKDNNSAILGTAYAYAVFDESDNSYDKMPFRKIGNVQNLLNIINRDRRDLFYPEWVHQVESEYSGREPFIREANRRKKLIDEQKRLDSMTEMEQEEEVEEEEEEQMKQEPMELESAKSVARTNINNYSNSSIKSISSLEISSGSTVIELDVTIDVDLPLGPRFQGDEYPRLGYVAEFFASREFGNYIEVVNEKLEMEGNRTKQKQRLKISLPLSTVQVIEGDQYIPAKLNSQFSTIGIYIKSLINPFQGAAQSQRRLDYEGECYINIRDKKLTKKAFQIVAKMFEIDKEYQSIGTIKVNSVKLIHPFEFYGEYSEQVEEQIAQTSWNSIDDFFRNISSEEVNYHPNEEFMRNKHTPIWPNTPFERFPSSLFSLNVPVGPHAYNGVANFKICLNIVCNAYGIDVETHLKKSLINIVSKPPDYKPTDLDKMEVYAVTKIIGETASLVPDLCDYKPDFAKSGAIGENYGEGTDGIDDCESVSKYGYSILCSVMQMKHEPGSVMGYIQEILQCYVTGLVDCSSSKPAARGRTDNSSEKNMRPEYRGKEHINHVLTCLIPFVAFYRMTSSTGEYDKAKMQKYYANRFVKNWYNDYLPPLLIEGTGSTAPMMSTCENLIKKEDVKNRYISWAQKFMETHYAILRNYPKLSQLGFQDNNQLKYLYEDMETKSSFSGFYTMWTHFWTKDMAQNGGPRVTDFLFCRHKSITSGAKAKWTYGVVFYDFVHLSKDISMIPVMVFKEDDYIILSQVAQKQVYPAKIPPILCDINSKPDLINTFTKKRFSVAGKSVLESYSGNKVIGILSQKNIIAYLNHFELYADKKSEIEKIINSEFADIIQCKVYHCNINNTADMIQFVFEMK